MTDTNIGQREDIILTYEVSDAALETAVGNIIAGNYIPRDLRRPVGLPGLTGSKLINANVA